MAALACLVFLFEFQERVACAVPSDPLTLRREGEVRLVDSAREIRNEFVRRSRINLLRSRYYDLLNPLLVFVLISLLASRRDMRCTMEVQGAGSHPVEESGVMGLLGLRFMTCVGMEV